MITAIGWSGRNHQRYRKGDVRVDNRIASDKSIIAAIGQELMKFLLKMLASEELELLQHQEVPINDMKKIAAETFE